jgi:hypothetical protein
MSRVYILFEVIAPKRGAVNHVVVGVYSTKKRAKAEKALAEEKRVAAHWRIAAFSVDQDGMGEYLEDNNLVAPRAGGWVSPSATTNLIPKL